MIRNRAGVLLRAARVLDARRRHLAPRWNSLTLGFSSGDEEDRMPRTTGSGWTRRGSPGGRSCTFADPFRDRAAGDADPEKPFSNAGEADGLVDRDARRGARGARPRTACRSCSSAARRPARRRAVHSGWRGVVQHAVIKTIERMIALSGEELSPSDFTVAIGPHIRQCCFEVGPEVSRSSGRPAAWRTAR